MSTESIDSTEPLRELDILRRALEGLRRDLPKSWRWRVDEEPRRPAFDAVVMLSPPEGPKATLIVEAKRLVANRDLPRMLDQLRAEALRADLLDAAPLVVARYLSPDTRDLLEQQGVSYADLAGNRRLALERPAILIRSAGASRDPWRGPGRPRGTLKGPPAARVVRWLADFAPPYTPVQVAKGSEASTGATYRVLTFLEEQGLVEREPRGPITSVRWRRLLERWSRDASSQRGDAIRSLLLPRGVEALVDELRSQPDLRYALTGTLAARRYAPFAPARFAMLYVDDIDAAVERLGLRKVDAGANVLVLLDIDEVAFTRTQFIDGVCLAAPSQIAVDLLNGPGRSPSEGEALLDWMETHEREWRG